MSVLPPQMHEIFGDGVGATLLTTLYARALGSEQYEVPGWEDLQAQEAWTRLSRIGSQRGLDIESMILSDRMNVVGTIERSRAIDRRVRDFVALHPSCQIVSLGLGMCNRASRLEDLEAEWWGVDNPSVIALRSQVLPDDDTHLIPGSVTDPDWMDALDPDRATVLVAEGLLMYLDRSLVTQLLVRTADRMRGPLRLVADMHHTVAVRAPAQPITRLTGARYGFGVSSPAAFAALAPGWRLVAADDIMSPITPAAARISRLFGRVTRGLLYGVITLEGSRLH